MVNMLYHILIMLNVLAASLLVGGMVEVALADVPMFLALSHDRFVEVHRLLDSHIDRYMPAITFVALFSALGIAFLTGYQGQPACEIAGIGALLGVIGISQFLNVPLNRRISIAASAEDIQDLRQRWIFFHRLRTILGCCSLFLFLIALVIAL